VPQALFSENHRLLEGLSEEVTRLRDENKGLSLSVESLTEENVLLTEKLGSFGERVSQFQLRFAEVLAGNQALLEERNNYKLHSDALSLQLAESESALQVYREQSELELRQLKEELVVRDLSTRRDHARVQKQMGAMQQYIARLEKECREQHQGRVTEFATTRQAAQQSAALIKELEATRQLLLIEESKTARLQHQIEEKM